MKKIIAKIASHFLIYGPVIQSRFFEIGWFGEENVSFGFDLFTFHGFAHAFTLFRVQVAKFVISVGYYPDV